MTSPLPIHRFARPRNAVDASISFSARKALATGESWSVFTDGYQYKGSLEQFVKGAVRNAERITRPLGGELCEIYIPDSLAELLRRELNLPEGPKGMADDVQLALGLNAPIFTYPRLPAENPFEVRVELHLRDDPW